MATYPYYGYSWTGFDAVLQQWNAVGVFKIMLPFLLFFVLIFGILQKINLFRDNKAINIIVSLVVSLLAIANPYVSNFLVPFFSNLAVGIAILVGIVILVGLFFNEDDNAFKSILKWGAFIAIPVILIVLANTPLLSPTPQWLRSFVYFLQNNSGIIIALVIALAVVLFAVLSGRGRDKKKTKIELPGR